MNSELTFKRVSRANDMIDELMAGIEQLIKKGPDNWKLQHVKLFELLLKDLPEQIKNLRINNTQINNYGDVKQDKNTESMLDYVMSKLPANIKMQFWNDVSKLADEYVQKYGIKEIHDNQRVIDGSISE